jgi:hypothetical protein
MTRDTPDSRISPKVIFSECMLLSKRPLRRMANYRFLVSRNGGELLPVAGTASTVTPDRDQERSDDSQEDQQADGVCIVERSRRVDSLFTRRKTTWV